MAKLYGKITLNYNFPCSVYCERLQNEISCNLGVNFHSITFLKLFDLLLNF